MAEITTFQFWFFLSAALIVGTCIGSFVMEVLKDREVHDMEKNMNRALVKEFAAREETDKIRRELVALQNHFDQKVEKAFRKRLSEWTPEVEDADEAFRQAEVMAKRREMANAGRSHPPRDDGGPSARLSRITFRR